MELFYAQSVAGLRIRIPLIKTDGTNATGATGLSTTVRTPAGATVVGTSDYTEATIAEIGSTGIYECYFTLASGTKVFTSIDQDNPYTVILDSTNADIDHSAKDLRIVSVMPWEVALEATSLAISGDVDTLLDNSLDFTSDRDTLTADGTEQSIYENATPTQEWIPDNINIDLSNMATDDSITIRTYIKMKSGGDYIWIDTEDYNDAQTIKGIVVNGIPNRYGYLITLEQTAGTYRDFDWERFNLG